jgi:Domain of unknown function (DUF1816)
MILLHKFKHLIPGFLPNLDIAWWIEITTYSPQCLYYFGPFDSREEAEASYLGYVEDLESEQAEGIDINIKYCKPKVLTVFDEEAKLN